MTMLNDTSASRYAVIGLGISGKTAALALLRDGVSVTVYDDNKSACAAFVNGDDVRAYRENDRLAMADAPSDISGCTHAVCSPGVPFTHPAPHPAIKAAMDAGCRVICDIDLMYTRTRRALHMAVTGTNGKSTTVSLIAHALRRAGKEALLAGNIGEAAAGVVPQADDAVIVTECSSFQLDLIADYVPHIAVWLNITPDHIDRHGDIDGYVAAKMHMFDRQAPDDIACIGVDDAFSRDVAQRLRLRDNAPRVVTFSAHEGSGADIMYDKHVIRHGSGALDMPEQLGTGAAARQNIAACYAAYQASGQGAETFLNAIDGFTALPHRAEIVAIDGGVTFINDSKATNADAARCALEAHPGCLWIVGGQAKSDGITPLHDVFPSVRHAYTIGAAGPAFAQELRAAGVAVTECETMDKALDAVFNDIKQKNDACTVLLSPACASFDQFSNFAARGGAFTDGVKRRLSIT